MKKFYSFLIYKLYRFALAQEDTVYPAMGFIMFMSVFELLHLLIIALVGKIIGYNLPPYAETINFIFLATTLPLNYIVFIRSKVIFRINDHFKDGMVGKLKGNFIFFSYLLFLFAVIAFEIFVYQRMMK